MSTNNKSTPLVVLGMPKAHQAAIAHCRGVIAAMIDNPLFQSLLPELTAFTADVDGYAEAHLQAATRAQGTVEARDAKRKKVIAGLRRIGAQVQQAADAAQGDATAVIASSGLRSRQRRPYHKAPLRARHGALPGTVVLDAKAVDDAAVYFWQYSADEATWVDVPESFRASATITGLTPGQTYSFRFRARTRSGAVGFSQVVRLIVN